MVHRLFSGDIDSTFPDDHGNFEFEINRVCKGRNDDVTVMSADAAGIALVINGYVVSFRGNFESELRIYVLEMRLNPVPTAVWAHPPLALEVENLHDLR